MEYIFTPLFFLSILGIAIVYFLRMSAYILGNADQPYALNRSILSPTETEFYTALVQAVCGHYIVFSKVRIADIVSVDKNLSSKQWAIAFNRIKAKHFDFVLCDPASLNVVATIELDDRTHLRPKTVKRDQFLNKLCRDIDLPLIRFKAKYNYVPELIAMKLEESLKIELPLEPMPGKHSL